MMKFFRKYTKHLLAIFMTLLLIVWLGGDALSSFMRGQQERLEGNRGEMFGHEVKWADVARTSNEVRLLEFLGLNWKYPVFIVLGNVSEPGSNGQEYQAHWDKFPREPLTELDWHMLNEAAQRNKVTVTPERLELFKENAQITPDHIFKVSQSQKVSQRVLNDAIASFVRVLDMAEAAVRAVQPSEADIQQEIRKNIEKARAQFVLLPYEKFVDANYQPTQQELTEQFEKYKNDDPQPGKALTFGYRVPSAVQIEYLKVDAQELIKNQKISDDEAYDYWDRNKEKFQYAVSSQPATSTAPAPAPTSKPYETFTEAKAKVFDMMKKEKANREALDIAREMIRRLNKPWESAPTTQPGGYREPPASETAADVYTKLADAMQSRYGKTVTYARTNLLDAKEFGEKEPQLVNASLQPGSREAQPLSQLAFMVAGLEEGVKNKETAHLFRNVYQTAEEPVVDGQGNAYVYRTVAVRPKAAPASVDVIREQLVKDIRLVKAAKAAEESAKLLAEEAAQKGLESALDAHAELKSKLEVAPAVTQPTTRPAAELVKKPQPFTRPRTYSFSGQTIKMGYIPGVGNDADLIETVFQMGAETASQPQRVRSYDEQNQKRWVVAQLDELLPITQAEYDQQRPIAEKSVLAAKRAEVVGSWFNPKQIRSRVQWKDAEKATAPSDTDEEGEETLPEDAS